jgi:hypothetical protein
MASVASNPGQPGFALPREYEAEGIGAYGFHGAFYVHRREVVDLAPEIAKKKS